MSNREAILESKTDRLLKDSKYIDEAAFDSIHADCQELLKLLYTIVKTSKGS